ncbi:MAG TPA: hypothetical protein VFO49_07345 [Nocardioides sp.]|nr:hypothetical protein [Nocardioides sp.]
MRTYRDLFAVAEFRVLFAARSLIVAAASVSGLALATLAYAETGSPLLSAFVMFGGPLVRLAAAPLLLSLADLWRPRTALAVGAGLNAVALALQAVPDLPLGLRLVLLVVPWVLLSAVAGATPALVADILPAGAFVFGRATLNIAVGVMQVAGYGAGGLLLVRVSTTELFLGAAVVETLVVLLVLRGIRDHPPRAQGTVVARSRAVNRLLLGSSVLRPVYVALWIPPGLVVGCESLLVPYGGAQAGFLFAATAVGMLAGDVLMGRVVAPENRERWLGPTRWLLAVPWVLFLFQPGIVTACALAAVASVGYCSRLPLQERLVQRTATDVRGHALGLENLGMMGMQGCGALIGGAVATVLGSDSRAAATTIAVLAVASLLITAALTPGLGRSRTGKPQSVLSLDTSPATMSRTPRQLRP